MTIRYQRLGKHKRISEIVFAGSHDASITSGSANAQTQKLDIAGQADAGVRLFDLRVLARQVKGGTQMVGYHGSPGGKGTKSITSTVTQQDYKLQTHKSITGEFGLPLVQMLKQARKFVEDSGEFLIFKFDKCVNYGIIADYCVELLGDRIYKPLDKEFGRLQLEELGGHVVCVFEESERAKLDNYDEGDGILGFKSLRGEKNSVGTYDPDYRGLQYFGKGGTNPLSFWLTNKKKREDNEGIQRDILMAMARVEDDFAANVLGMMYWTSTGSTSSIRVRNKTMWSATGVRDMHALWEEALEAAISTQLRRDTIVRRQYGGEVRMKAYFPNIVMIDFASLRKCQTVYDLNTAADRKLAEAYQKFTQG